MSVEILKLIDKLESDRSLSTEEYAVLISSRNVESTAYLAGKADAKRREVFGNKVYIRGLIEVGNYCRNDCYYCGIRRSNRSCERYRLTPDEILGCCREGYKLGFRTFVLQGGEGVSQVGEVCGVVNAIKEEFPECALTLSLGEYTADEYAKMRASGADRYLLRHETANRAHYEKLHPPELSFDNRRRCLYDLRSLGFQVGCGFMVGSPGQTVENIAEDLKFIEEFSPHMCGIGPFIPQKDTPFRDMPAGSAELTIFLLSVIRLIKPTILLPAGTALGTILDGGRERGILAGANVVMPNLTPLAVRSKYALYDNKLASGAESAQSLELLKQSMNKIGFEIVSARGDSPEMAH